MKGWILFLQILSLLLLPEAGRAESIPDAPPSCRVFLDGEELTAVYETAVCHQRSWTAEPALSTTPVAVAVHDGPCRVEIIPGGGSCESALVRPLAAGIRAEVRDGTLELLRTGLPWSRALLLRMAITLVLELGLGFALGYRKRQQIAVILIVNVATQLLLNFLLMPKGFALAPLYFGAIFLTESLMKLLGISGERVQWIICMGIVYAVAEGLIVVIEAVTYNKLLPRWGEKKRFPGEYTLYAIAANLLSFLAGFFLQRI